MSFKGAQVCRRSRVARIRHWARMSLVAVSVTSFVMPAATTDATHDLGSHSPNTTLVGSVNLGGELADIAFWGNLAVVSQHEVETGKDADGATHGFSVVDIAKPTNPVELSRFVCTGGGSDVSVWGDLVFLSVDSEHTTVDESCSSSFSNIELCHANEAIPCRPKGWHGLKIASIADPAEPVEVGSVSLPCGGSHTNTLVPDVENGRVIIYASAGLTGVEPVGESCDMIVEVPLGDPAAARVIGTFPHEPNRNCHDMTAFAPRKLLAAACVTDVRVFDIADPAAPRLISVIVQPGVAQHGAAFSNDGNTLVTGEEDSVNCHGGTPSSHAAIWFYDITDARVPILRSYKQLERGIGQTSTEVAGGCGSHYFNVVPTRGDRDILVAAWYAGGMNAIDFTDPGAPTEIAYYQPSLTDPTLRAFYWSAYWYRGHVYATNGRMSERDSLDVYRIDDPLVSDTYRLPHLNPQSQEALSDTCRTPTVTPPSRPLPCVPR